MNAITKVFMLIDSDQVLQRIPPSYFLKKDSPADIFDGIFGPRLKSLSDQCITQLAKHNIQLEFIEQKDLMESKLKNVNVVVLMDTVSEEILNKVKCVKRRVLFVYESIIMDKNAHEKEYQQKFSHLLSYNRQTPGLNVFNYQYPVRDELQTELVPFSQRKFCCMIASSKTTNWSKEALLLRETFIQFFSEHHHEKFDLWGSGWDKTPFANSPVCKGLFEGSKHQIMSTYRFAFCPENIGTMEDYITEKIWHAFRNGVIPIYIGPPNIDEYIPKSCYIDLRDYLKKDGSLESQKLYDSLSLIDEEKYNDYLQNISNFLKSDIAQKFTPETFIEKFTNSILS